MTTIVGHTEKEELKENYLPDMVNFVLSVDEFMENFSQNMCVPNYSPTFAKDIFSEYYVDVVEECKSLFHDDSIIFEDSEKEVVDIDKCSTLLVRLINRCKKIEAKQRQQLEKICADLVIKYLSIPKDTIVLDVALTDDIKINQRYFKAKPSFEVQFESEQEIIPAYNSLEKRKMIKYLIIGYSLGKSYVLVDKLSKYGISEGLIRLYKKIMILNQFLLFNKLTYRKIEDKNKNDFIMGIAEVKLGHEDEQVRIVAQGSIFPSLLIETIKGCTELFTSHGLPKDENTRNFVLQMTDNMQEETFGLLAGPSLWKRIGKNVELKTAPYFFRRMSVLKYESFLTLTNEILLNTVRGEKIFNKMIERSNNDYEENSFSERMTSMQTDRNIITDEYIHPSEL